MLGHITKWRTRAAPAASPGYADADVAEITVQKTRALNADTLRAMSAQSAQWRGVLAICYAAAIEPHRPLRVLDFGGACGLHYLIARTAVPDLPLRWAVVETPMMAERAASLATDDLRFFSNAETAASWLGGVDLLHSSGTLQYLPDPTAAIRELCGLGASMMAWLRIFVSEKTERGMQTARLADHGPGPSPPGVVDRDIIHPITELSRASFFAAHDDRYSLVWNFDDGDQMDDRRSAAFVFRRKESPMPHAAS